MGNKNPLDDIVDELVVFKHEDPNHPDGEYFSNNPMWRDSRVREHWMSRNADKVEAPAEEDDDEDYEEVDYETMTNDDLRAELVKRGLGVDGKKVDLIKRLQDNDAEEAEIEE